MHQFLLYHRHAARDCTASFAAWNGYRSPLRRHTALATCGSGGHEIWWEVTARDEHDALAQLPGYVAANTVAVRVSAVDIP